jgi:uncharacterized membrane protein YphA (DoxX/SURF4 family)
MLSRALAVVRILIGGIFLWLGIRKLADPAFLFGGLMHTLAEYGTPYESYRRFFLQRFVDYNQEFFAYAVALGAILLGLSFLLGAMVSWASLGGAFLMLNFGLATSAGKPLLMALHALFALLFLALGRFGAGATWGVDGWLAQHIREGLVFFPLRLSWPRHAERK